MTVMSDDVDVMGLGILMTSTSPWGLGPHVASGCVGNHREVSHCKLNYNAEALYDIDVILTEVHTTFVP